MRISLIPLNGGAPFVVADTLTLVGRSPECELQLDEEGVADLHCVLAQFDGLLILRDLGTGNTLVNGQRYRRAVLLSDDKLAIAGCRFRVRYEEDHDAADRPDCIR
jgi:predicted component of type VI protein secretion system